MLSLSALVNDNLNDKKDSDSTWRLAIQKCTKRILIQLASERNLKKFVKLNIWYKPAKCCNLTQDNAKQLRTKRRQWSEAQGE